MFRYPLEAEAEFFFSPQKMEMTVLHYFTHIQEHAKRTSPRSQCWEMIQCKDAAPDRLFEPLGASYLAQ